MHRIRTRDDLSGINNTSGKMMNKWQPDNMYPIRPLTTESNWVEDNDGQLHARRTDLCGLTIANWPLWTSFLAASWYSKLLSRAIYSDDLLGCGFVAMRTTEQIELFTLVLSVIWFTGTFDVSTVHWSSIRTWQRSYAQVGLLHFHLTVRISANFSWKSFMKASRGDQKVKAKTYYFNSDRYIGLENQTD